MIKNRFIALEDHYVAHHYSPLPIVISRGQGIHVWDDTGKQYIDCLSAYSAVSHGHSHPKLIAALTQQATQLTLTSRAFYHDQLGPFAEKLCKLTGQDKLLPMNTGAEAVETAIKAARKWAYTVKGVANNQAEIITCHGNFHGRTTTIVGFSSESQYRQHFGPFAPGFKQVPYGNITALEQAITANTAALLIEPIQGEGGIIVPPPAYLSACQALCKQHNILLIFDEIQTGLGRTGHLLAAHYDNITPDALLLGKALGGGVLPIAAFLSKKEVMDVFIPGDHGSTFGGNPLACAVATTALDCLLDEGLIENANTLGTRLIKKLRSLSSPLIKEVRGRGLLIGIEINPELTTARLLCEQLLTLGILSKDSHNTVIRLAPPLTINAEQIDKLFECVSQLFTQA